MALNFSSVSSLISGGLGRVASLLVFCNLAFEAVAAPYQAPGTKRMAERLEAVAEMTDEERVLRQVKLH